ERSEDARDRTGKELVVVAVERARRVAQQLVDVQHPRGADGLVVREAGLERVEEAGALPDRPAVQRRRRRKAIRGGRANDPLDLASPRGARVRGDELLLAPERDAVSAQDALVGDAPGRPAAARELRPSEGGGRREEGGAGYARRPRDLRRGVERERGRGER